MFFNWANKRVLCVGDYARDDDYPQSIQKHITSEVERYIAAGNRDAVDTDSAFYFCFYSEAYCVVPIDSEILARNEIVRIMKDARFEEVQRTIKAMYALPGADVRVLCNLSKGEYVRESTLRRLVDNRKSKYFINHYVGLQHILATYICWSSDPSCSMRLSDNIQQELTRGKWAGDCFEVVHEDDMRPDITWKDVSDEAVERLARIWKEDMC